MAEDKPASTRTGIRLEEKQDETEKSIRITVPVSVVEQIREKIRGTSFRSVPDFIERMVLAKFPPEEKAYTEEEEEIIHERLRKLGYIE